MSRGSPIHVYERDVLAAAEGVTAREAWARWQAELDPNGRDWWRRIFTACCERAR